MATSITLKCAHCGRELGKKDGLPYCAKCGEQDREANYFACCLLMPSELVQNWVRENGPLDICDDDQLKAMAKHFGVSMTLAAIRLFQLGFFTR